MLAFLIVLLSFLQCSCLVSEDTCCATNNCKATSLTWVGGDAFIAKRAADETAFYVLMSRMNRVPRYAHKYQSSDWIARAMFISVTIDGQLYVLVHWRSYGVTAFLWNETINRTLLEHGPKMDECDELLPKAVREVFHCDTTDDIYRSTEYVASFPSDDGRNVTHLVIHYWINSEEHVDGWNATVHHDNALTRTFATTAKGWKLSGWYTDKKRMQQVLVINDWGHLCFYERPTDVLHFVVPDEASMFMPQCIPSKMLFGCPQSLCYTGLGDEVTQAEHGGKHRDVLAWNALLVL